MSIIDVIKYEGDNTTFIWKHPAEDFNTMSQLVVNESQEAIFFRDGQALDTFGPGRYTLETQNIPILNKIVNLPTGGVSAFHCEVYFINKTVQMAIRWGTDSKVRFIDPLTGVPLEIGASGEMNLMVSDSRKLLIKLVGTTSGIAWDDNAGFTKSLKDSFWPLISQSVKVHLSNTIKARQIDLLEVDSHLAELSDELGSRIVPGFEEYGLTIPQFYVTSVLLPDNDPNFKRIRELHAAEFQKRVAQVEAEVRQAQVQAQKDVQVTEAQAAAEVTVAQRSAILEQQTTETEVLRREAERQVISAQAEGQAQIIGAKAEAEATKSVGFAEAEVMRAKGYDQKDVLQAEVQKAYAEGIGNMGSGGGEGGGSGIISDMLGLGVGLSAAGAMMPQISNMMQGAGFGQQVTQNASTSGSHTPETSSCAKCGSPLPVNAKFCLECGEKVVAVEPGHIICPTCGNHTPSGKFCMECGAPLAKKCPSCGANVPPSGRFCLECGERL